MAAIAPAAIGSAYGSRGPLPLSSVNSGCGRCRQPESVQSNRYKLSAAVRMYPVARATTIAATPPASAAYRAVHNAWVGPSQAPTQAISLTSPAPRPPSANRGRKNDQTGQPPFDGVSQSRESVSGAGVQDGESGTAESEKIRNASRSQVENAGGGDDEQRHHLRQIESADQLSQQCTGN